VAPDENRMPSFEGVGSPFCYTNKFVRINVTEGAGSPGPQAKSHGQWSREIPVHRPAVSGGAAEVKRKEFLGSPVLQDLHSLNESESPHRIRMRKRLGNPRAARIIVILKGFLS
jgi:hypothetical protein